MKLLRELSPAESLLLMNRIHNKKDMLKVTFQDLILRGVITIIEITKKANPRDKYLRTYKYITRGSNYEEYDIKSHEQVFVEPFIKSYEKKILVKTYIKLIHESVQHFSDYLTNMSKNPALKPYFKQNAFTLFWAWPLRNKIGKSKGKELKEYLKSCDRDFIRMLDSKPEEAAKLLSSLGGNMILLNNVNLQKLKDSGVLFEKYTDAANTYSSATVDLFWSTSDYDFDAGCSSSSGCSSCSGCGGCGGCGGCS